MKLQTISWVTYVSGEYNGKKKVASAIQKAKGKLAAVPIRYNVDVNF